MKTHRVLILIVLLLLCLTPQSTNARKLVSYTSTADRSLFFQRGSLSFGAEPLGGNLVRIDVDARHQSMDGFGAALTGSSCYNLMQMSPKDRKTFLQQTFSTKKGLGFSYIRISIGCSDFSLSDYTCCDTPGIENFALTSEETDYVIPILKEILKIQPKLKIMGSPWTCPRWMKVDNLQSLKPFNSWNDGQLNPRYYQDYATYFVRWVRAFEQAGVPIYSVTVQNEPLNRGNSASLFMGWKEQQQFVAEALGPAFQKAGLSTKIYAFDHNYNYDRIPDQQQYPLHVYDNEVAATFLAGAAYHNYGGNRSELLRIGKERPDKELIFTETSIGMWNDGRNLAKRLSADMSEIALGTVEYGCGAVIVWNLMLDTDRGPYRPGGCASCYGAVDIDRNDYHTITYNSHYYIIGHLSCVVRPGAIRLGTNEQSGLMTCAFLNPDNTLALVVLNKESRTMSFSFTADGRNYATADLPPHSVTSYIWKP
ncbi:MAG: glycoside hydrolase family 30 beta sandwich domain-containing protein [Bacteroidales bacterium]|nr:glycoside hydrolase family 30 beta sandwich domain-containing protein [Bacteroidales bacterium]